MKSEERRAVAVEDRRPLGVETWRMRRLMELLVVAQRRKWEDSGETGGMRDE